MSGMRYIYQAGKPGRVMHIQKTNNVGQSVMEALCGINHDFDRTINAPWGLGRKICSNCKGKIT